MPLAFFLFCLCVEDVCFSCTQLKLKTHSYSLKIWRQALDYIYHHSFKKNYLAKPKKHTVFLKETRPPLKIFRYRISVLTLPELSQMSADKPWRSGFDFFLQPLQVTTVYGILIIMASNELFHALWFLLECNNQYYFSCGAMMQKCQKPEPIGPKMKKLVLSWDILTMVMQLG